MGPLLLVVEAGEQVGVGEGRARDDPLREVLLVAGRLRVEDGVHGVADKRLPAAEIVRILDRVNAGELVLPDGRPSAAAGRPARGSPADYTQRLGAFLTPRERQVLGALVRGRDTVRLAKELGIAETTARCHIQSVLIKLGAHSRLEAATTAVRFGMIEPQTGRWLLPVI